ncbi:hypothetical protein M422DRAFT_121893, partial [Sphaerobolus stellatus SS14]
SLVLENTGSVARDHLACERTWLAYMRTGVTIAGVGVAFIQLIATSALEILETGSDTELANFLELGALVKRSLRWLGAAAVLVGIILPIIGFIRYFAVQKALINGMFPAARMPIALLTFFFTAFVAVAFAVLV